MRQRSRHSQSALTVAAILLFCAVCIGSATNAHANEIVTGFVLSSNQVMLEGAAVNLEGFGSTTTDAAGRFAFHGVPPGNYRMTVSKQGFPDLSRPLPVFADRRNRVVIVLAGSAAPASPASPPTTVSVPILHMGSGIFAPVRLNEQVETLFLVDTGATYCVLTKATADRLGLTAGPVSNLIELRTASGSVKAPLLLVDLVQVGAAEARNVEAIILDRPDDSPAVGGILGLSFLNHFKVEIDRKDGVMILSR